MSITPQYSVDINLHNTGKKVNPIYKTPFHDAHPALPSRLTGELRPLILYTSGIRGGMIPAWALWPDALEATDRLRKPEGIQLDFTGLGMIPRSDLSCEEIKA